MHINALLRPGYKNKNQDGVASATREKQMIQASLTRRVSVGATIPGLKRPG